MRKSGSHGRRSAKITFDDSKIVTSKTVNGIKHSYILDGTKILRETWGNEQIIPLYDNEDSVCGLYYEGLGYYFLKNLQGDVIAITDQNGQVVAKYAYDARFPFSTESKCRSSQN